MVEGKGMGMLPRRTACWCMIDIQAVHVYVNTYWNKLHVNKYTLTKPSPQSIPPISLSLPKVSSHLFLYIRELLENWWLNDPLLSFLKANKLPYNFSVLFVGMHLSFILVSCLQALLHSNIRLLGIFLISCLLSAACDVLKSELMSKPFCSCSYSFKYCVLFPLI